MFFTKRIFRVFESLVYKTLSLFSKIKNKRFIQSINSACKNQFDRQYLLSNNSEIKYC